MGCNALLTVVVGFRLADLLDFEEKG